MSRSARKILVIVIIFAVAAAAVFGFLVWGGAGESREVAGDGTPCATAVFEIDGRKINTLYGHVYAMDGATAAETVTPVPADGNLKVVFSSGGMGTMSYKVTDETGGTVVAQGAATQWESDTDGASGIIPLAGVIKGGRRYRLEMTTKGSDGSDIHYYGLIVNNDGMHSSQMLDFAEGFHDSMYDRTAAADYATYMEPDASSDGEDLSVADIHSSFNELTYGTLSPTQSGDTRYSIINMDENMGTIKAEYKFTAIDENGLSRTYSATEVFCLQYSELRFYMMSYERTISETFEVDEGSATDSQIYLGIGSDEDTQVVTSENGNYTAFRKNGELWEYDHAANKFTRIVSAPYRELPYAQACNDYDISIVSVKDSGDIDYVMYGYMSTGPHAGCTGFAGAVYDSGVGSVDEKFFIASDKPYQILKTGLEKLYYDTGGGSLYVLIDDTVYAVDCRGGEVTVIVESALESNLSIDSAKSAIAWQQGGASDTPETVQIMHLDTGGKISISADDGQYVLTGGFVGTDCICTKGLKSDISIIGDSYVYPQYELAIYNSEGGQETVYSSDGIYISDVSVNGTQINIERLAKTGSGFVRTDSDTLVQNTGITTTQEEALSRLMLEKRGMVCGITLADGQSAKDAETAVVTDVIAAVQTDIVSGQTADNDTAGAGIADGTIEKASYTGRYYAYSGDSLLDISDNAGEAIAQASDGMGWVIDGSGRHIWIRTAKDSKNEVELTEFSTDDTLLGCTETILDTAGSELDAEALIGAGYCARDILNSMDGYELLSLDGCTIRQLIYYLDRDIPIMALMPEGGYVIIKGYDQYNITVFDPSKGEYKIGQNDAATQFEQAGGRFIAAYKIQTP